MPSAVMLSAVMLSVIAPLLLLLLPSFATLKYNSFYLIIRLAIILFYQRYFLLCSEYSKTSLRHTYDETVFLVVCDPSMNELWVTQAHRDICTDLSRSLSLFIVRSHTTKNTASGCYVEMAKNCTTTFSITRRNMFNCDAPYLRHYA
jgi:hypothetical protein